MSATPKVVGDQWFLAAIDLSPLVKPTFTQALDLTVEEWTEDNREDLTRWFRDLTRWTPAGGPAQFECTFEEFCTVQYEMQLDRDEAEWPFDGEEFDDDSAEDEEDSWFI